TPPHPTPLIMKLAAVVEIKNAANLMIDGQGARSWYEMAPPGADSYQDLRGSWDVAATSR
ncbi:hypothetical protein KBX35_27550, partial [Micromonospora sp. C32]|uniref:hypothetical protein n=1 Tax=Micromonospora sp. C32 TaxID=2824877 RepID=UPI001B382378